jgi:hypothetical protein
MMQFAHTPVFGTGLVRREGRTHTRSLRTDTIAHFFFSLISFRAHGVHKGRIGLGRGRVGRLGFVLKAATASPRMNVGRLAPFNSQAWERWQESGLCLCLCHCGPVLVPLYVVVGILIVGYEPRIHESKGILKP